MKKELKLFVVLNLLALIAWGVVGGVYGAYQAVTEMDSMAWTIAFGLLLLMVLILAGAIEYYAFLSLVRFLRELRQWFDTRDFLR